MGDGKMEANPFSLSDALLPQTRSNHPPNWNNCRKQHGQHQHPWSLLCERREAQ